jgi:hypothetical protein
VLEVVRIEERGKHLIALGCEFIHPPSPIPANIRAKVAARLSTPRKE